MKHFDIVTIGAATRDVFLKSKAIKIVRDDQFSTGEAECFALGSKIDIDEIVFETGGGATNTAVGFQRQGFRTSFVGKIGAYDQRGKIVLDELESEGVDTSLVKTDPKHMTAYSAILLTPRGERTVLVFRGASANFRPIDIPWSRWQSPWMYVTSLGGQLTMLRSIWRQLHQRHRQVAWNPGAGELAHGLAVLTPLIKQTDILLLNQDEATQLFRIDHFQYQEALERLRKLVRGVVVITLGADGSVAGTAQHTWHASTHAISVTDTTGAGDAFGCGFTGTYIRTHGDIAAALRFATANSESVIQTIGAKAGLLKRGARTKPVKTTRTP